MKIANCADETDVLKRVKVRLLAEHERPELDRLLTEKHCRHDWVLTGQALRYVAELDGHELDGQWVALIALSAASLHLKAREKWLGWSARQRGRRLPLAVNNRRFLVLPERRRYPNLASRVLGLCLRRLNADWQERWHHPVRLVASFVDESHDRGTCYRASGFAAVGFTNGFVRERGQDRCQLFLPRPASGPPTVRP